MKGDYYKSLITGFYAVCAEKGFIGGFIDECRRKDIPMWKVERLQNGKVYFCAPCSIYSCICKIAENSGTEIRITGSFGFLPSVTKHSDRLFLALFVIIALLFVSLMSLRIWNIEVEGNDKVFSSEIISSCEELGLRVGVRKSQIDVEDFQRKLIEKMSDKLLWVSLNMEGMCARIEVREIKKNEDDIIGKPCNVIADFDGVINIYRVYSGTPEARAGDGVHKGDLLISGVTEYLDSSCSFSEARGKITAEHIVKVKTDFTDFNKFRSYTKTMTYYSVSIFGLELFPYKISKDEYEITKELRLLKINNVVLPFGINRYNITQYDNKSVTDRYNKLISLDKYLCDVRETFKNSVILTHTEKYRDGYNGKFKAIDYLGQKSVILLEN